jgi:hypothetical protein
MKKLIYGGLFLTLLGSGFVSCKKQKLENNSKPINEKSNFEPKTANWSQRLNTMVKKYFLNII